MLYNPNDVVQGVAGQIPNKIKDISSLEKLKNKGIIGESTKKSGLSIDLEKDRNDKSLFQRYGETLDKRLDQGKGIIDRGINKDTSAIEAGLLQGANIIGGVADLVGDTIVEGFTELTPEEMQDSLKDSVLKLMKTQPGEFVVGKLQEASTNLEDLKKYDPVIGARYQGGLDVINGALTLLGGKAGTESIKKGAIYSTQGVKQGVKQGINFGKKGIKKIKNNTSNLTGTKPSKIAENIAGIDEKTKNILKNTTTEEFDYYINAGKKATENIKNPTPLEIAGNEASDTLGIIKELKSQAGARKSNILKGIDTNTIETKPILDDFNDFLSKSNLYLGDDLKITTIKGKTASVGDDSIKEIQKLSDELLNIFTTDKVNLNNLDSIVDRIQDTINYNKLNRAGAEATKTEKQISGFLGGALNKRLKDSAGKEFIEANDEFRKLLSMETELAKLLGDKNKRGGSLMKAVFSPTDRGIKRLFSEIQEATGVDLVNKAGLAKFSMQVSGDPRQASLLEAIDIGAGFTSKLSNKFKNIPILGDLVELGEAGAKKMFSPEKVGRNMTIGDLEAGKLSDVLKNSLKNNKDGIKKGRLDGDRLSFNEIENGNFTDKRIILDIDENGKLYIIDGRHLLEAFNQSNLNVPKELIEFSSDKAKEALSKILGL